MSKQSHTASKEAVVHLDTIAKIAKTYSVTLRDLLGHSRKAEIVHARCALAHALRAKNLTYAAIGEIINRDPTSVRQLLRRRAGAPKQNRKVRDYEIATRGETERLFFDMCKRGSAALALAILNTGKAYRPMPLEEQLAVTEWAKKSGPVRPLGWLRP